MWWSGPFDGGRGTVGCRVRRGGLYSGGVGVWMVDLAEGATAYIASVSAFRLSDASGVGCRAWWGWGVCVVGWTEWWDTTTSTQ